MPADRLTRRDSPDAAAKTPLSTGGSMRLVWVGALVLLITSLAALFSNPQSGRLLEVGWASAAHVLPDEKLSELQRTTPAYTSRVFALFPEPLRQRFAAKPWTAVEVMTFRSLLLWRMAPSVLI